MPRKRLVGDFYPVRVRVRSHAHRPVHSADFVRDVLRREVLRRVAGGDKPRQEGRNLRPCCGLARKVFRRVRCLFPCGNQRNARVGHLDRVSHRRGRVLRGSVVNEGEHSGHGARLRVREDGVVGKVPRRKARRCVCRRKAEMLGRQDVAHAQKREALAIFRKRAGKFVGKIGGGVFPGCVGRDEKALLLKNCRLHAAYRADLCKDRDVGCVAFGKELV